MDCSWKSSLDANKNTKPVKIQAHTWAVGMLIFCVWTSFRKMFGNVRVPYHHPLAPVGVHPFHPMSNNFLAVQVSAARSCFSWSKRSAFCCKNWQVDCRITGHVVDRHQFPYTIGVQLQSFPHCGGGAKGMASPNSLWPAKTSEETTSSVVVIKSLFQQYARVPLLLDGL